MSENMAQSRFFLTECIMQTVIKTWSQVTCNHDTRSRHGVGTVTGIHITVNLPSLILDHNCNRIILSGKNLRQISRIEEFTIVQYVFIFEDCKSCSTEWTHKAF